MPSRGRRCCPPAPALLAARSPQLVGCVDSLQDYKDWLVKVGIGSCQGVRADRGADRCMAICDDWWLGGQGGLSSSEEVREADSVLDQAIRMLEPYPHRTDLVGAHVLALVERKGRKGRAGREGGQGGREGGPGGREGREGGREGLE